MLQLLARALAACCLWPRWQPGSGRSCSGPPWPGGSPAAAFAPAGAGRSGSSAQGGPQLWVGPRLGSGRPAGLCGNGGGLRRPSSSGAVGSGRQQQQQRLPRRALSSYGPRSGGELQQAGARAFARRGAQWL
eukprot:15223714-Alexandrium_andersonii.AAC.1